MPLTCVHGARTRPQVIVGPLMTTSVDSGGLFTYLGIATAYFALTRGCRLLHALAVRLPACPGADVRSMYAPKLA